MSKNQRTEPVADVKPLPGGKAQKVPRGREKDKTPLTDEEAQAVEDGLAKALLDYQSLRVDAPEQIHKGLAKNLNHKLFVIHLALSTARKIHNNAENRPTGSNEPRKSDLLALIARLNAERVAAGKPALEVKRGIAQ